MIGLLLIALALLWIVAAVLIVAFVFRRLPERPWRLALMIGLILFLVPLPLLDEIIGGLQFTRLCEQAMTVHVDETKARDRVVQLRQIPYANPALKRYMTIPSRNVPFTFVPIREDSWDYVDPVSGEVIVSYKTYAAMGGWLIRALGFSEGDAPLTFRGHCEPQDKTSVFRALGITTLDPRTGEKP